jgi:hypothetical protein
MILDQEPGWSLKFLPRQGNDLSAERPVEQIMARGLSEASRPFSDRLFDFFLARNLIH